MSSAAKSCSEMRSGDFARVLVGVELGDPGRRKLVEMGDRGWSIMSGDGHEHKKTSRGMS
jgi:hypothetical protein